jgi:hypothetical protein
VTVGNAARPGRGGARRPPGRRAFLAVPALLLASCSGGGGGGTHVADGPAVASGRYPIATAPSQPASPRVASPGHYQLVSAGDAVHVQVGTARVLARMSGPEIDQSGAVPGKPPPASAPGVLTVTLSAERGTLDVPAGSFLTLGERRDAIRVRADRASLHVAPGHPATLHLSTIFRGGHTTFTWQPGGTPLVTWDFVVELD